MKFKTSKRWSLCLTLGLMALNSAAAVTCSVYPQSEWANQDDLKQLLAEEGYSISMFKIDNYCYEIYGKNKQGKKVEIYLDMKTLAIVAAEIEK